MTDALKAASEVDPEKYRLIIVCPDSSSQFTRPRTELVAGGIAGALEQNSNISVLIFPSFSSDASESLGRALSAYGNRIYQLSKHPIPHLLYGAALMDFADAIVTPDTSTLHLAAAEKVLTGENPAKELIPKNRNNIVALFGATSPALFSYPFVTTLGRGRKEQRKIQPGLYKNGKTPDPSTDYLSHILPADLTSAIVSYVL